MDLSELIRSAKGDRSLRDLARASARQEHPLSAASWHQLSNPSVVRRNFPDPPTIRTIATVLGVHGMTPPWHYHLIDVENLAVGFLAGMVSARNLLRPAVLDITLPWSSDDLSRRAGVEPPTDGRHTAMGDAEWARAIYDRIIGRTDPA